MKLIPSDDERRKTLEAMRRKLISRRPHDEAEGMLAENDRELALVEEDLLKLEAGSGS
ncbi:MAG: hypothetical protein ACRDPE_15810 [Solirubrobacterales bacterium]